MNERKLVEALHKVGVSAAVVDLWDEDVDGEVAILGTALHVQCGDGYLIVTEQVDEGTFLHHGEAANVAIVVPLVSSLVKRTG
jgi:hypothetical protein